MVPVCGRIGITLWQAARRQARSLELLVLTAIVVHPACPGFIVARTPLYDNFRQIFFILPPVFLMAGIVFERISSRFGRQRSSCSASLPGIIAGLQLHPYEYIYYNRFIGGEAGAFRRFELDYWGTSYREAAG